MRGRSAQFESLLWLHIELWLLVFWNSIYHRKMIKKSTKPQVSPKWNPSCAVLTLGDGYGSKGLCSAATALGPAWREHSRDHSSSAFSCLRFNPSSAPLISCSMCSCSISLFFQRIKPFHKFICNTIWQSIVFSGKLAVLKAERGCSMHRNYHLNFTWKSDMC